MYFKEKEDTNIDKEFEKNKKFSFDFQKYKPILLIGGGILLLLIIILVIIGLVKNSGKTTIELLGEKNIILTIGNDYVEPGYKAYDKKKNDITKRVKVTSDLDTSKAGNYEIIYSVDKASKVRYITVTEIADTYIHLLGDTVMRLKVGEKYEEPGYTVYDRTASGNTPTVTITGTVDTSKKGTYQLTYTTQNSKNVTITAKRTIIVG